MEDALRTLYMSKRSYNAEIEKKLYEWEQEFFDRYGAMILESRHPDYAEFEKAVNSLFKWGQKHITMLRFIDFTCVVTGLHRGATDDFDSHAKRLENRIIRSSTRLGKYEAGEMSDWYKEKIIPTDAMAEIIGIDLPEIITVSFNGQTYVKTVNGYVRQDLAGNKDVERGLLMLSIPMDFTFKCNVVEWAHIYKERGQHSNAAPELKEMVEEVTEQLHSWIPWITREYLMGVRQ